MCAIPETLFVKAQASEAVNMRWKDGGSLMIATEKSSDGESERIDLTAANHPAPETKFLRVKTFLSPHFPNVR